MLKPELRHVLTDATGRDYFLITGRIGEHWSYRVEEQPDDLRRVECWNQYQWTELVVVAGQSAEDAVVTGFCLFGRSDPRLAVDEPEEPEEPMPPNRPLRRPIRGGRRWINSRAARSRAVSRRSGGGSRQRPK